MGLGDMSKARCIGWIGCEVGLGDMSKARCIGWDRV